MTWKLAGPCPGAGVAAAGDTATAHHAAAVIDQKHPPPSGRLAFSRFTGSHHEPTNAIFVD